MKKYMIIFVLIIVTILGFNSIKSNFILKDAFVFNHNDIVSATLFKEQGIPDDFDYKIHKDLSNNISNILNSSKKKRIHEGKFSSSYSPKGIEIFLDGEEIDTIEGFSLTYKRHITLIKEENDNIHVSIDINDIKNNEVTNLLSRYYIIKSKKLGGYIEQLYK